jgi:hypothetical protein
VIVRDWVEVSFPIGKDDSAVARLKFAWPSETEVPSAQSDVLLQILVDQIGAALQRSGSEFAPATPQAEPVVAERAAVLASLLRNS